MQSRKKNIPGIGKSKFKTQSKGIIIIIIVIIKANI